MIALDLLKNAVFLKAAAEDGVDADYLYSAYWEPELDRDYWRENRRAGRLHTKNGDLFLQYWLVAELAEPVPATTLFDTFRAQILQPAVCPPMSELIPTLVRDAATLRRFQAAPPDSPERRFSDLLELLDTTTLMPIALQLLRSNEISAARRANAFLILESFLVRRMLCGWTTKNYNRLAASLIGEIRQDLAHADTALAKRLAAETAPANRWPSDDDLRTTLLTKDMYGQRRQDRLVMVFRRIENYLRATDNKHETGLAVPSNLTLEHLIPQSWESHWPLDDSHDDPLARRSEHLHRLGNLTVTSGPLNSSLSNLPWHGISESKNKRSSLIQHSLLKLNTAVVNDYPDHFDENAVDTRGAGLTELIIKLWPGADAHSHSDIAVIGEAAAGHNIGGAPPVAMEGTNADFPPRQDYELPSAEILQHRIIHGPDNELIGTELDEPKDLEKHVQPDRVGPEAKHSGLYWDFWEQFRDRVATEHPEWQGRAGTSRTASNSCLPTGTTGTIFCSVFKRDGLRFELAFVRPDPAVNLARFEALHAKQDRFEEALGQSAFWDRMPGKKDARVYAISPFGTVDHRVQWPAMMDWLIDQHVRFKRAIQAVGGLEPFD